MSWASLHHDAAWFVVGLNVIVGAWALAAHWIEPLRHRALWWATLVAELAVMVQVVLGALALAALDGIDAGDEHVFYGFLTVIAIGILYSYRPQIRPWQYLLYGGGGLFIAGLAIRAITLPAIAG